MLKLVFLNAKGKNGCFITVKNTVVYKLWRNKSIIV